MNWNLITGTASTIAMFAPVLLIILFRLFKKGSLLALSFYYLSTGIYNLMSLGFIDVSASVKQVFGTMNNYLDAPIMFTVLLFFCLEKWQTRVIYGTLAAFIIFELL